MILHRLRLTNFRGVADREIVFPECGVVVVCGPNEVGKSSMLEALDLLLEYKDRSSHQKVKQVKPTHADVGAEVEAEISTGPYRFTYRKQFHKKPATLLTVLQPSRATFDGDEAHDKVLAMLEETVDTHLWQAQRVLQACATEAVSLSGCDALARALDAAAGEVTAAGGTETLLIDRIEDEFARYFTPTGRPAKEWKAAIDRLAAADSEVQRREAAVAEVEQRVVRHEELNVARRGLRAETDAAEERLAAAAAKAAAVTELAEQVTAARLEVTAAAATATASAAAQRQRESLIADLESRAVTLAGLQEELAAADEADSAARTLAQTAATRSEVAATELAAAQQRMEAARAAEQSCAAVAEADRLAARLQLIDETQRAVEEAAAGLAAITLTPMVFDDIITSAGLIERLQAQLSADATSLAFTAAADITLTVDGEPVALKSGQTWTPPASAPVTVEVPGVLSVRVDPGATAAGLRAQLDAAQSLHAEALAQGGVADLMAAREVEAQRTTLTAARQQAVAALEGLCCGEDPEAMRTRLAELRAGRPGTATDAAAAEAELRAAAAALDDATSSADRLHNSLVSATAEAAEKATAATVLRKQASTAEAELAKVRAQLDQARAAASDDALAAAAATDAGAQQQADRKLADLTCRYRAADPDAVNAEHAAAAAEAGRLTGQCSAIDTELAALAAQLEVIGSEGRRGHLDDAQTERDHAAAEHVRIGERADAVAMLRETMLRHRDTTRQRYVQPYRAELERLGRTVFGDTFEVEVDTDLTIRARTLDGRTVPYESLSGGAREQLGILARLAGAALVADDDTVPVVIDDALGFSDPDRLANMGRVFDAVGDSGQVIVLTCQRDRYAGITDATVIQLPA